MGRPPSKFGETNISSNGDSNNANYLLAQSATLSGSGTIQSLSFYVTAAAGKLRLGIYDATGPSGGPGNLLAQTTSTNVTTTGWNTINVTTPVALAAGTYWLAYTPNNGGLGFVNDGGVSGGCFALRPYLRFPARHLLDHAEQLRARTLVILRQHHKPCLHQPGRQRKQYRLQQGLSHPPVLQRRELDSAWERAAAAGAVTAAARQARGRFYVQSRLPHLPVLQRHQLGEIRRRIVGQPGFGRGKLDGTDGGPGIERVGRHRFTATACSSRWQLRHDQVMTSPDGITWTAQTAPSAHTTGTAVAYGNGLFVAWRVAAHDDLARRHHLDIADATGDS